MPRRDAAKPAADDVKPVMRRKLELKARPWCVDLCVRLITPSLSLLQRAALHSNAAVKAEALREKSLAEHRALRRPAQDSVEKRDWTLEQRSK